MTGTVPGRGMRGAEVPHTACQGPAQELLLGFLRGVELEVNALYPAGHETAE